MKTIKIKNPTDFYQIDQKAMYIGTYRGGKVLKSYNTLVAVITAKGKRYVREGQPQSTTTARHISIFFGVEPKIWHKYEKRNFEIIGGRPYLK